MAVVSFERAEPNDWIAQMLELLPDGTEIDSFTIKMPVEPGEDAHDIHERLRAAFEAADRAIGGPSSIDAELSRDADLSTGLQELFRLSG
jgi:hypothetical protein